MKKLVFAAALIAAIPAPAWAVNYTSTTFYITAHEDDWALFMYPYWDVTVPSVKVIFMNTTAGDSGYLNGPQTPSPYYLARENGARRAARFLADVADKTLANETSGNVTVNGHSVFRVAYKNTVSYFLRLPDGTLATFEAGGKSQAVDGSTTYTNWKDFTATMTAIVQAEGAGTPNIWLNTQDNSTASNPGDHPDHYATGDAVTQVKVNLPCVNVAYHVGYAIAGTVNLDWSMIANKAATYGNVVSGKDELNWVGNWDDAHKSWLPALLMRGVLGNGQACAFGAAVAQN